MHIVEIAGTRFVGRIAFQSPLQEFLAVHVVLDHARIVVAVGQIPGVVVHKGHERWPPEMRIVVARNARRAQSQEALLAIVGELGDEVVVGVDDPEMFLGIVGAHLDVVRAAPDRVPLRPVFDHLAVAIEDHDDVLPAPIDARPAGASVRGGLAAAGSGAGGLAHGHSRTHWELQAGPDLRKSGCFDPGREHRQLALLRDKHTVGSLGEYKSGLRPSPPLVVGQTLGERFRPVLDGIVGAENVLPAFKSGDGREPLPRSLLLAVDHAQPVTYKDRSE